MIYKKYFKTAQKVQLRAKQSAAFEGRNALLNAIVENVNADHFDLSLPYGLDAAKQFPFSAGMPFELSTDAMGLGVKVSVIFVKALSGDRIRVQALPDLQMFQRRTQDRLDCTIGLRFTRGQKPLHALRQIWEKNVSILSNTKNPPQLQGFNPCQLNLSSSGIRFAVKPPAEPTNLCLMLLDLGDAKAPICALGEIVWTSEEIEDDALQVGMQFIDILEQDQKRIAGYIRAHS